MELPALLVAQPRVDDHRARAADDQRTQGEGDAIVLIGRGVRGPHRLRHNAKHGAAIETEKTVAERDELHVPERETLHAINALTLRRAQGERWRMVSLVVSLSNHETGLLEFDQDTMSAGGMNERHQGVFGSGPWLVVDEPRAPGFEVREGRMDVLHAQRDVMQAGPSLPDVFRDRRFRCGRFQQLELRFTDRHEMRAHALGRHILGRLDLQTQRVAIKRQRRRQVLHRDADMIEHSLHKLS